MKDGDKALSDIVPGSAWVGDEGTAVVVSANACYVRFRMGDRVEIAYHEQFRERFSPPYDSRKIKSQFSMSIAVLAVFHAFWSPSAGRFFARSTSRHQEDSRKPARGAPALPQDAVFVNTYASPAKPEAFLEDLNDLLACTADSGAA